MYFGGCTLEMVHVEPTMFQGRFSTITDLCIKERLIINPCIKDLCIKKIKIMHNSKVPWDTTENLKNKGGVIFCAAMRDEGEETISVTCKIKICKLLEGGDDQIK